MRSGLKDSQGSVVSQQNRNLWKRLKGYADKPLKKVVGLMSGTSARCRAGEY